MKPTNLIAKFLFSAALLWAPAARALILTTWEVPTNLKALEGEYAANTNVVTVLNLGRSADDGSVTMLYRKSNGKLAAVTVGEDAFLSRFSIVKGGGGAVRSAAAAPIEAKDESANYSGESWLYGRGGSGWSSGLTGAWLPIKGAGNIEGSCTVEAPGLALETKSEMGEVIVRRELEAPIENVEVSVRAWQDAGDDFRGFALYGEDNSELFRWGVGLADVGDVVKHEGFVYSLLGGEYLMISEDLPYDPEEPNNIYVDYSLSWKMMDGGVELSLLATYKYGTLFEWSLPDDTLPAVASLSPVVASFAVVATGDVRIVFDDLRISGTPVPEPCTLALLAAGAAVLAWRRRSRRA